MNLTKLKINSGKTLFALYTLGVLIVMSQTGLQIEPNEQNPRLNEDQAIAIPLLGRKPQGKKSTAHHPPLVVTAEHSRVTAKDEQGKSVWQLVLPNLKGGHFQHLIHTTNQVFVATTGNRVYRLTPHTGQVLWATVVGQGSITHLRKEKGHIKALTHDVSGTSPALVVVIDANSGQLISRTPHDAAEIPGDPELPEDLRQQIKELESLEQKVTTSTIDLSESDSL